MRYKTLTKTLRAAEDVVVTGRDLPGHPKLVVVDRGRFEALCAAIKACRLEEQDRGPRPVKRIEEIDGDGD